MSHTTRAKPPIGPGAPCDINSKLRMNDSKGFSMIKYALPTLAATLGVAALFAGAAPASAQTPGHFAETNDSNSAYTFKPYVPTGKSSFTFSTDATFTPDAGGSAVSGVLDFSAISTSMPVGTGTGATEAFTLKNFDFSGDTVGTYDESLTGGTVTVTQRANGFYLHGISGGSAFEFSAIAPGFSLGTKSLNQPFSGGAGSTAPVPEASSMLSLGAMVLLGGGALALRRRKSAVQAA